MFAEEFVNIKEFGIYSATLFVVMLFGHYVPSIFRMGKTAEKWFLIVVFGFCLGVTFNMVIPGSLDVVTEAYEVYNHSYVEPVNAVLGFGRRLHGGDGDEDSGFRRLIGVSICTGFMIMFFADYVSKEITKKQRSNEIRLPLATESIADGDISTEVKQPEQNVYTNCALKNLYSMYYIFAAIGCTAGYLICDCPTLRRFIIFSQIICLFPTAVMYGFQMSRDNMSEKKKFVDSVILSCITPILNIIALFVLNLFQSNLAKYVIAHGYPLYCGLLIFFTLMYIITMVHIEATIPSALLATVLMVVPYFIYMIHGSD